MQGKVRQGKVRKSERGEKMKERDREEWGRLLGKGKENHECTRMNMTGSPPHGFVFRENQTNTRLSPKDPVKLNWLGKYPI